MHFLLDMILLCNVIFGVFLMVYLLYLWRNFCVFGYLWCVYMINNCYTLRYDKWMISLIVFTRTMHVPYYVRCTHPTTYVTLSLLRTMHVPYYVRVMTLFDYVKWWIILIWTRSCILFWRHIAHLWWFYWDKWNTFDVRSCVNL